MAIFEMFRRNSPLASAALSGSLPPLASPFSDYDSTPLISAKLDHLIPPWANGRIDRAAAMTLPAVAKGRNLVCGTISRCPLIAMNGTERVDAAPAWCSQPEPERPRSQTINWTLDALLFYGRAFWLVRDRYATGYPRYFRFLPEADIETDEYGRLVTAYGQPVKEGDYIRFDSPNDALLISGARHIRAALALEQAAARAALNPVPSVELHQTKGADLTQEEIDALVDAWAKARNGSNGGVAYTSQGIEVNTHGQPAEQLMIEARAAVNVDTARALGLPAWALDAPIAGASMTYSNSWSRARELIDFGLSPYMAAITDRLSMDDVLSAGRWAMFDTTALTRPAFKERMDGYAAAIAAGIYSAEECKLLEQGVPLENNKKEENGDSDS